MRPLRQLLFDFLVDLSLSLERFNLLLHLVVFDDQELGLLGLMLKLCCQLMVLENREASCCLELLVVESE